MQWSIDDVPIYIAVVEHNSLSAAARHLDISKSTVSKSLNRLEQALGIRLLERNSRNIRITSDGEVFYRHALLILEQVSEADAVMSGLTSTPSGKLVVALPMAFARECVAPRLGEFRQAYPRIDLEIIISSLPVDIIRDQIDVAVVVGSLNDSELIVKKLYESRLMWVASPDYAATRPLGASPEELLSHIQLCEKRYGLSQFPIRIKDQHRHLDLSRNITHVNDPIFVREAVMNGAGISPLPNQYCEKHIAKGQLVQVYRHIGFDASASELSAIYPSRRLRSNKTRVFIDFLVDICEQL